MKLSIVIPTFNSSDVLGRALNSIITQTFTDWEVLIMDGVSTDNTIKIAQSYKDNRIHIYSEPDKGIYEAMNKGIKKANGEWLYFLGSDDWLLNKNVLQQVFYSEIDGYDVIYGNVEAPQLWPQHSGEWSLETLDYNRCHQGIFYRKTIFRRLGYYNLEYPVLADYDLNLKWFFSSKIKKKYISITIAHYSMDGYNTCHKDSMFIKYFPYMKLTRGWNYYSQNERRELIKQALQRKSRKHPGRWLLTMAMYIINR